jgi:hypothetical protein
MSSAYKSKLHREKCYEYGEGKFASELGANQYKSGVMQMADEK